MMIALSFNVQFTNQSYGRGRKLCTDVKVDGHTDATAICCLLRNEAYKSGSGRPNLVSIHSYCQRVNHDFFVQGEIFQNIYATFLVLYVEIFHQLGSNIAKSLENLK